MCELLRWTVVSHFAFRSGAKARVDDLVNAQTAGLEDSPLYVGTETYFSPSLAEGRRTVLRHFATRETAVACQRMLEQDAASGVWDGVLVAPPSSHIVEDTSDSFAGASLVISARRDPEDASWVESWQERIDLALSQSPGFLGRRTQPPIEGVSEDWVTIVSFDTDQHLNDWLASPKRLALLAQAEPRTHSLQIARTKAAFTGWFSTAAGQSPPPTWRTNAVVLLVLFPLVSLLALFVSPYTQRFGFGLSMFANLLICTTLLGFVLVPRASHVLRWWLRPDPRHFERRTAEGMVLILAVYGAWIIAVSWLATHVR